MSVHPSKALGRCCERCGAVLRQGHSGRRCDPCSGQREVATQLRESGFFNREPVRRALAACDFGSLFRAVRRATGLTQIELGEILGMGQERISRIECGENRLRDFATVVRVAARLGIPAELLGFRVTATSVEHAETDEESSEVDGVLRRTFSGSAVGIVLGLGLGTLDLDRLARLLPADATESVGRVGTADVAEIEHTTDLLRRMDMSRGGESCRRGAVQQLRSVLPLLRRESTSEVQDRLLVATADLGKVAAWASYDAGRHAEARRLFLLALEVVQHAEHPSATDLTALLLILMTNQAIQLGQPRDGLSLIQLGYSIAGRRTQPLSPSRASELACYQGWCQAAQGDVRGCDRALGQAIEHLTHADLTTATPWSWCLTTAELTARHGHAYYTLAQTTTNPKHAARAVPLLQQAVDGFGPAFTRARALNLPGLAGACALAGDLDTAAYTAHQAVQEVTALASPRTYDRLRTLNAVLAPHNHVPAISEVRKEIHTALTAG